MKNEEGWAQFHFIFLIQILCECEIGDSERERERWSKQRERERVNERERVKDGERKNKKGVVDKRSLKILKLMDAKNVNYLAALRNIFNPLYQEFVILECSLLLQD